MRQAKAASGGAQSAGLRARCALPADHAGAVPKDEGSQQAASGGRTHVTPIMHSELAPARAAPGPGSVCLARCASSAGACRPHLNRNSRNPKILACAAQRLAVLSACPRWLGAQRRNKRQMAERLVGGLRARQGPSAHQSGADVDARAGCQGEVERRNCQSGVTSTGSRLEKTHAKSACI